MRRSRIEMGFAADPFEGQAAAEHVHNAPIERPESPVRPASAFVAPRNRLALKAANIK